MSQLHLSAVMDVSPWPQGHGFAGASVWWDYVLSKEERKRLDHLMGMALLDSTVRERLVYERDDSLLAAFGLCEETRQWLRSIRATSLTELAEAVVSGLQNIPSPLDIKPGC